MTRTNDVLFPDVLARKHSEITSPPDPLSVNGEGEGRKGRRFIIHEAKAKKVRKPEGKTRARIRMVDGHVTPCPYVYLVDDKGELSTGVPASPFELLMWDEICELKGMRSENKPIKILDIQKKLVIVEVEDVSDLPGMFGAERKTYQGFILEGDIIDFMLEFVAKYGWLPEVVYREASRVKAGLFMIHIPMREL